MPGPAHHTSPYQNTDLSNPRNISDHDRATCETMSQWTALDQSEGSYLACEHQVWNLVSRELVVQTYANANLSRSMHSCGENT